HRRAHAEAHEAELGDGRVDHPLRPVLVEQPARHLVGAVVGADLLAHEEDVLVAREFLVEGLVQRFAKGQLTHAPSPARWGRRRRRCRVRKAPATGSRPRSGSPPPPRPGPPGRSFRARLPWRACGPGCTWPAAGWDRSCAPAPPPPACGTRRDRTWSG